jgi:hypothetical protein
MEDTKTLNEHKSIPLSDLDVMRLVQNKAKVLTYGDLANFDTLDEVLEPYGSIFLLYEAKPNFGHWCCVFKMEDNTIEFFDPYGGFPDTQLDYIPEYFRKVSGQYYPHLSALLYESPYNLTYNEHKFQKHGPNINTCGRWCALRMALKDLTLKQFSKLFKTKYSDYLATLLTLFDLDY